MFLNADGIHPTRLLCIFSIKFESSVRKKSVVFLKKDSKEVLRNVSLSETGYKMYIPVVRCFAAVNSKIVNISLSDWKFSGRDYTV